MSRTLPILCLLLSGCAGPAPVPKALVEQEEIRLLRPFLAGVEVGSDELVVEMTANFHDNVGRPAVDPRLHTVQRSRGDGYTETRWLNITGELAGAFTVTIGEPDRFGETGIVRGRETRFTAVRAVRIRVFEGRHPMTLDAIATGNVVLLENGTPKDLEEFRVQDGRLQVR